MNSRLFPSFLVAAAIALVLAVCARADQSTNSIKFSDPARPGTVKISVGRGELHVQGADTAEVTIKSNVQPVSSKPRKDGMRVLSASSGFSLEERDNVVTIEASQDWGRNSAGDFHLTVPRNTNVIVQNAWGGDISCRNLSGDIEINSMRGEIQLDDVSGGIVVGTMSGEIHANIRELHEGKALSFTSMNGEVVIRVPETAKANVRLRTQNGSVLTDFDEKVLVSKSESSPGLPRMRHAIARSGGSKVITVEVEEALREATRISATAVKEALEAVKQGLEESRLGADEAKRQVEEARRDMERARREADQARRDGDRERRPTAAAPVAPAVPAAPATAGSRPKPAPPAMPKIPAVPTISGGNLVTGTLNGGGPEISVSTMNGDVVLRKLQPKK